MGIMAYSTGGVALDEMVLMRVAIEKLLWYRFGCQFIITTMAG